MSAQKRQLEIDAAHLPAPGSFIPNYLLYLLAATSDAASSEFHGFVRRNGLKGPEWRVLACLYDEDGLMVTRLAELALMEQSRLTKLIDQMDNRDLVRRGSDEIDRRRVRVYLTAQGRELATYLVGAARQHEVKVMENLLPGEAELLKTLLRRLYGSLSAPTQSEG